MDIVDHMWVKFRMGLMGALLCFGMDTFWENTYFWKHCDSGSPLLNKYYRRLAYLIFVNFGALVFSPVKGAPKSAYICNKIVKTGKTLPFSMLKGAPA